MTRMQTLDEQANAFAEVQKYLVRGASELFEKYGLPVSHSFGGTVNTSGPSVMAVIGYAAESVRGALLLLTSRALVDKLRPEELRKVRVPEDVVLRDVLGEFSNMLLGRIKSQLSTRGLAPLLTTPTTIIGEGLELPAPTSGLSAWHRFSSQEGELFIRLDATFDAEFALSAETPASTPPPREGVMVEF
jgi:CheY-specific phosphatase CheX